MLGLHTAKRRKAAVALAAVGALMGLATSPAFAADVPTHAEAEGQAVHIEGGLLGQIVTPVLDGGTCAATYDRPAGQAAPKPTVTNAGTPANKCGDNLSVAFNNAPLAYAQDAKANSDAQSGATASVAKVTTPGLDQTLDLNGVAQGLTAANTSALLNGVTNTLGTILGQAALQPLIGPLNTALQTALTGLNGVATVTTDVAGVTAECTADPSMASGKGHVDGIHVVITLGGGAQTITLNVPVGTDRNSDLIYSVPDIANQVLDGVFTSLGSDQTLGAALAPLSLGLQQVRDALNTNLLQQLKPVLAPISTGLQPIVQGTVNEQTDGDGDKVTSGPDAATGTVTENDDNDPQITVQALDVKLFQGTPLEGILRLGRVNCGKNTGETVTDNGNPGLQFDKDADTDHGDAKFTLTVHNPLNHAVNNVFVQDFYGKDIKAKDVKDVNASQGTFNKDTGRWDVGTLAPGATAKLTFKVDASKSDLDDGVKNAACVNQSTKPANIQKNDGFAKDTDGCDETKAQKDKKDGSDSDSDGPKSVDSGLNDGGNLGPLAITGLLAASTLIGSAARQRLLLDR